MAVSFTGCALSRGLVDFQAQRLSSYRPSLWLIVDGIDGVPDSRMRLEIRCVLQMDREISVLLVVTPQVADAPVAHISPILGYVGLLSTLPHARLTHYLRRSSPQGETTVARLSLP